MHLHTCLWVAIARDAGYHENECIICIGMTVDAIATGAYKATHMKNYAKITMHSLTWFMHGKLDIMICFGGGAFFPPPWQFFFSVFGMELHPPPQ